MKNTTAYRFRELESEIKKHLTHYKKFYKTNFTESSDIEIYWENEFFGWKIEAYQDILALIREWQILPSVN